MASDAGRFLRDNAFLVAAVSLPVVVVCLFLLFTAIPRWTVPPPAYDLLLRTTSYDQASPRVSVEFFVRDGKLHATLRPPSAGGYPQRHVLWLLDHRTLSVRQLTIELPDQLAEGDTPTTMVVDALSGRHVLAESKAPDGYEVRPRTHRGPGLIGDLFGMRRHDQSLTVINQGRVVTIDLPAPYEYQSPVFVGWLMDDGTR